MNTKTEKKILASFKKVLAAPEATAKRHYNYGRLLILIAVAVAFVGGHLMHDRKMNDAGQLLAILSGVMIGLSFVFFMSSNQALAFAKFCIIKSEYRDEPNQTPQRNA